MCGNNNNDMVVGNYLERENRKKKLLVKVLNKHKSFYWSI